MLTFSVAVLFILAGCGAVGADITSSYKCMAEGRHCDTPTPEAGPQGISGLPGPQGVPGQDGVDGKNGVDGRDGIDGEQGEQGQAGPQGGRGEDGQDAQQSEYDIVSIVSLCPNNSSVHSNGKGNVKGNEILLRLADGSLLAVFSSGGKVFMASIGPGSYVTTDGRSCKFTVDEELTVEDEEGNVYYAQ